MPVVELNDREVLAGVFRRNASAHVYELGDLDDFEWRHTRWFGWESDGRVKDAILLYTQPEVPVLIAIADSPRSSMQNLLGDVVPLLPPVLYTHASASLLGTMGRRYEIVDAAPHLKLALRDATAIAEHTTEVETLAHGDLDEITTFYETAYPGTWFDPRMLATARYVGIRAGGHLACIAGVHVYSPRWSVAALGNVATAPELRGQGLARGACAALCRLLLDEGIETIALNVRADNKAAIRAYTRLGFEPVAEYTEASLVVR
jgi:RimJ/RimL family protein N-acetyltransferase